MFIYNLIMEDALMMKSTITKALVAMLVLQAGSMFAGDPAVTNPRSIEISSGQEMLNLRRELNPGFSFAARKPSVDPAQELQGALEAQAQFNSPKARAQR